MTTTTDTSKNFLGLLDKNFFNKTDAFTTIIGMQFMTVFIYTVFDPLMLWLIPDSYVKSFDILLPDNDDTNNDKTIILMSTLIRKILMLCFVIAVYHYVV